jgi:perosamine synthetase
MYRIPLIKPWITEETVADVAAVLRSGYLTEGPVTAEFEKVCADFLGVKHVLAVCNCTVGLEMALRAAGIGPGDEVIVPDYTYPATASVVRIVGADLVLADINPCTMVADVERLEAVWSPRVKAVMPVSLFGLPLDYDALNSWCKERGVVFIEDAACSIGAEYCGRKVGNMADVAVFSLHPRKFITTGEGGLIATASDSLAEWMWSYKHFGMDKADLREAIRFGRIGTNYKLSNVQAAIGLSQMRNIETLLARRRLLAAAYDERLHAYPGIRRPQVVSGGLPSYQTYCIMIPRRDEVMAKMRSAGIEVQIGSYALSLHPAFSAGEGIRHAADLRGSLSTNEQALALPLFHDMTESQIDETVSSLLAALGDDAFHGENQCAE